MFVLEKVPAKDRFFYEEIKGLWYKDLSSWCADRENNIFIVCSGKMGVETPVIFYMYFKNCILEFWIWEIEYRYRVITVKIPSVLEDYRSEIENTIKLAYAQTNGLINLWSLPFSIDGHTFEFKTVWKTTEKPQKLIKEQFRPYDLWVSGRCPVCGFKYEGDSFCHVYCKKCSQLLIT